MDRQVLAELLLPLLGTALGAGSVFLLGGGLAPALRRGLAGFAAGVMAAASVWSLLLPAMDRAAARGERPWVPAAAGIWLGALFLLALDRTVPHLHRGGGPSGPPARLDRTALLVLAVTLHNIPEGMAVGAVLAARLAGEGAGAAGGLALSLGIALQNLPEGAVISLPLREEGMGRRRAFLCGVLSGTAEPLAAVLTVWASGLVLSALPLLLSFAAGAMLYVVAEELLPEAAAGEGAGLGALSFAAGFTVMLVLDGALG